MEREPLKILMICDYFPPGRAGGVWEVVADLKREFEQQGAFVYVLTTGKVTEEDASQRIFRTSSNALWGVLFNNFAALRMIRRHKITVLHMHQPATTFFLWFKFLRKLFSFPRTVLTMHGSFFALMQDMKAMRINGRLFRPSPREYLDRFLLGPLHVLLDGHGAFLADELTCVSPHLAEEWERITGRKVRFIPNALSKQTRDLLSASSTESSLENDSKSVMICAVGQLRWSKRLFHLIYALHELIQRKLSVRLVIVGGGGHENRVRALLEELNLGPHVQVTGKVDRREAISYIRRCDVFCHPSSREGMSMAVLEAMALGRAIVVSEIPGMTELLKDGETGLFARPDSVSDLADKLELLIKDAGLRERLGSRARIVCENQFTLERTVALYRDCYLESPQIGSN